MVDLALLVLAFFVKEDSLIPRVSRETGTKAGALLLALLPLRLSVTLDNCAIAFPNP